MGMVKTGALKQAVILRSAGWTLAGIANKTGISCSTLQRHFSRLGISKCEFTIDSIDNAKNDLLLDAGFMGQLKSQIAASIVDDLAISRQIRESLVLAVEELANDKATPASFKARALAALSTTLSITQAVQRKAMNLDDSGAFMSEQALPSLRIFKMTEQDVRAAKESIGTLADEED